MGERAQWRLNQHGALTLRKKALCKPVLRSEESSFSVVYLQNQPIPDLRGLRTMFKAVTDTHITFSFLQSTCVFC